MKNYHKLLELHNNNVKITISNRYRGGAHDQPWNVGADKSAEGVTFSVDRYYSTLEEGIDDIHSIWLKHTKTLPEHRLNVLEHRPFNPDDPDGSEWNKRSFNANDPLTGEDSASIETPPLGVYYVIGQGFFDSEGVNKGETFYNKWNTRWADFPNKNLDEHELVVATHEIPY